MHSKRRSWQRSAKRGFVLIAALSLMAFILILIVSMTILLRVETQVGSTARADLQAREAARLALMMALGDLQKHAGPDQRVTARAKITGVTNNNRYWTGVWDTTAPAAPPAWLVSGSTPDPTSQARDSMELVGPGTVGSNTDAYVNAPAIEIPGTTGQPLTRIAWWISDEGVKASMGKAPLNLRDAPNFLEEESIEALALQLASTQGLEELFSEYDRFTAEDESTALAVGRIHSVEQLLETGEFKKTNDFSGEMPFHSITLDSYGVLASVISDPTGPNSEGLMSDLSLFPELLGRGVGDYLSLGELHANKSARASTDTEKLRLFKEIEGLSSTSSISNGDYLTPIVPVLSNFMIAFTIRSQSPVASNPNFYLRMRFFSEFWNPYTNSLSMRSSTGDNLELELEISGLPEITVTKTTGSLSSSSPISIQDLLKDPSNTNDSVVIRLQNNPGEDWLPGRTKNWTGVDANSATDQSPYTSILVDSKDWNDPQHNLGGSTGLDTGIPRLSGSIRHSSTGSDEIDIRVFLVNTNSGNRTLVTEYTGYEYEAVSTRPSGYSSGHSGTTFGYHIQLRGPHLSSADTEYYRGRWLYEHDPRNPQPLIGSDWYLDNDPLLGTGSAYAPVKDGLSPLPLPVPAEINETDDTINTVVFRRPIDRSGGRNGALYNTLWQDAPVFELPRERVLSLASLQHLYIHNERPFQVGNSWGASGANNELEWFDRYFFSGLSRSDAAADYDNATGPPNPALISFDLSNSETLITEWQSEAADNRSASKRPAEHFLISNRFNINSTSVAAWKAVLGSLRLGDWNYLDYPEDDTSDLSLLSVGSADREATFARFSHSLEETYEAPDTPDIEGSEPVAPSAFYRHGARRLDSEQLENLAEEIVNLLKDKAQPFTSMEEFLSVKDRGLASEGDKSLIEEAITNALGTSTAGRQEWYHEWETNGVSKEDSGETPIEIDHFSPGFLTQADIMTAIGSMLSPRSDTFKIRARSQSYTPEGEPLASATIEATLQRIPDPIDQSAEPSGPTQRQFKLLRFRWLTDEEI